MLKLSNKIIRGNSLEEIKKIPNNSFDLVFADPPYNMQIGKTLTRPDTSKVNGVNDKWDKFNSFNHYDDFCINNRRMTVESCMKDSILRNIYTGDRNKHKELAIPKR